jgi:hypothetical protein
MMKRLLVLVTVVLVMAAMMLAMAMPAFAFQKNPIFEDHPLFGEPGEHTLLTGDCGQGNCTGFGIDDNPGEDQSEDPGKGQSGETGDDRNDVCAVCIGTRNN